MSSQTVPHNATAGQRYLLYFLPHKRSSGTDGGIHHLCRTSIVLRHDPEEADGNHVDIVSLRADRPGQGDGTQALRMLRDVAALYGVTLSIYARAMDDDRRSTTRLVQWYQRHGFIIEDPHGTDWNRMPEEAGDPEHPGATMYRPPVPVRRECDPVPA